MCNRYHLPVTFKDNHGGGCKISDPQQMPEALPSHDHIGWSFGLKIGNSPALTGGLENTAGCAITVTVCDSLQCKHISSSS